MTRFGKNLVMVGLWAGIGILIGMQFGSSGGGSGGGSGSPRASTVLPGWSNAAGTSPTAPASQTAGTRTVPPAGGVQSGQAYVYVPVSVDPVTGEYTIVPVQPQATAGPAGGGSLPQQEVADYSRMSPEQILIPEEQKPTVDKLADKTAGLLQEASQKSIRWVVSLFDSAEK
ncbi:hypothetical protein [Paenibacillus riograndensis]|uniref:Uncharacterized protein n=2 Tax=Paenibacillus riograndensis TaxID=483937 RepID=A0A132TWL1_9BACL|nr:hypothetical protein [Paenibacillus riograndensis]KWX75672.1 hypothetical protein AMQ84_16825 [Paenibacillus riograndensis]CQR57629.1 putative membrane protein [Paenibacillus riograndensis SBR5]